MKPGSAVPRASSTTLSYGTSRTRLDGDEGTLCYEERRGVRDGKGTAAGREALIGDLKLLDAHVTESPRQKKGQSSCCCGCEETVLVERSERIFTCRVIKRIPRNLNLGGNESGGSSSK
ncbi:hypothetical protein O3P69_010702 [Scylla paramamosain]|uniref:Uncharacterized protein n=1 Tax=Scylla paramamosain TaxID=85552 RepID=A0AAW0TFQ2_SCYPA